MPNITIRYQRVSDAKRFYEILRNPNFEYFHAEPKSIKDEKKWLGENPGRRKNNTAWNYSILFNGNIVGGIGVKINFHRKYIGEIGYFIDENYWGRGIASGAVECIEDVCFKKLKLTRLEILMRPENKASEKVAIKNGYFREGLLRNVLEGKDKKMNDALLYAKVL